MKQAVAHFVRLTTTIKKSLYQLGLQRAKQWCGTAIAFLRQWRMQMRCGLILAACLMVAFAVFLLYKGDFSSFTTQLAALLTLYVAAYAIAWAKYEFHVSRQSQQMSVLAALCATDKRKSFAPALAEITNKKLSKHPTLFTPRLIWASLCALPGDKDYLTEDNRDTIDMVAKILLGFDDWEGANLQGINLSNTYLFDINLENTNMERAILNGTHLHRAQLNGALLFEAQLMDVKMDGATLKDSELLGAKLSRAKMRRTDLRRANLYEVDFSDADLRMSVFEECDLNNVKLHGANMRGAKLSAVIYDERVASQLAEVLGVTKTLYQTNLPPSVEEILRRERPRLFQKPY